MLLLVWFDLPNGKVFQSMGCYANSNCTIGMNSFNSNGLLAHDSSLFGL